MISQVRWIEERADVRNWLAAKFKLPVGNVGTEMAGGKLVSDGRSAEQLYKAFNIKDLQAFVDSEETDVYQLFDDAVQIAKRELKIIETYEKPVSKENTPAPEPARVNDAGTNEKTKARRGRPKKESGNVVAPAVHS